MSRHIRKSEYLVGDAHPEGVPKGNVREELKRMTAWLTKRGEPNGYRPRRRKAR